MGQESIMSDPAGRGASGALDLPRVVRLRDGSKCTLRTMVEEDARELCSFLPQTHVESDFLNYVPGEFDKTIQQEREFIREHLGKARAMAVVVEMDRKIIAIAGAESLPQRRFAHRAEFGLTVLKRCWRKGLGRILTEYAVAWARHSGLRKLELRVFAENVNAIALYQSLGFAEEARLRDDRRRSDGRFGDTLLMARFFEV